MLASEIVTRIRRAFADNNSVEITDADVIRWINDGQKEIVGQLDLLQQKATTAPVANIGHYVQPSDLLKMHSIKYNGKTLEGISLQQAEELFPSKDDANNIDTGTPTHFWMWGGEVYFYPVPTNGNDVIMCYYNRMPVEITDVTQTPEIPAIYHNRLVEYCMAQAYELDQDPASAQEKLAQFQNGVQSMRGLASWEEQDTYPFITDLADGYYGVTN